MPPLCFMRCTSGVWRGLLNETPYYYNTKFYIVQSVSIFYGVGAVKSGCAARRRRCAYRARRSRHNRREALSARRAESDRSVLSNPCYPLKRVHKSHEKTGARRSEYKLIDEAVSFSLFDPFGGLLFRVPVNEQNDPAVFRSAFYLGADLQPFAQQSWRIAGHFHQQGVGREQAALPRYLLRFLHSTDGKRKSEERNDLSSDLSRPACSNKRSVSVISCL